MLHKHYTLWAAFEADLVLSAVRSDVVLLLADLRASGVERLRVCFSFLRGTDRTHRDKERERQRGSREVGCKRHTEKRFAKNLRTRGAYFGQRLRPISSCPP